MMQFRLTTSITFLFLFFLMISCTKKSALEITIECANSSDIMNSKKYIDVNKNYQITIPNNWKVQKYYDAYQSDIFAADTLKQLTQTYILNTSFKNGELELNTEFELKIKNSTLNEIIASEFEVINEKFTFWYLTEGIKNNYKYHELVLYFKTSVDTYLQVSVEIYGDDLVNERLCEAISIIKTIKFI